MYRLKDGNFEHFEFMGAGKKILGARRTERSAFESYMSSESFIGLASCIFRSRLFPRKQSTGSLGLVLH